MSNQPTVLPTTWEMFCEQTGRDPLALPDVSMYAEKDKAQAIANFKLPLIIRHCNGEEPDYTNPKQDKWEPWWRVVINKNRPSGVGLSFHYYGIWYAGTRCGPRFAFLSTNVLDHVVEHFIELYNDLYLF